MPTKHALGAQGRTPILLATLEKLINHALHYATMRHAHPDAGKDAANARALMALALRDVVTEEEALANARLMLRAPELLHALEDIIGPLDISDTYGYRAAVNAMDDGKRNAARKLLAKIKGDND